jgi:excisionase family DNA binding protein
MNNITPITTAASQTPAQLQPGAVQVAALTPDAGGGGEVAPAAPHLSEVNSPALVVSMARAATLLGTCKRTIERERDRGRLRCLRIGRVWKVRVGELHAYLRRMEAETARK